MGKLIKVAAQSRTQNINFVVQGESGSATYDLAQVYKENQYLSLIHISEPTRPCGTSRMPSSA